MKNIVRKIVNKVFWIFQILRSSFLSFRYGISPSKRVIFGKRVRIVNPQYIDIGGASFYRR